MISPRRWTLFFLLVAGAVALPALVAPVSPVSSPYASALSSALVTTAQAATACEDKKCEINSAGSQSKCVASAGTLCQVESVHGRGHGRICQTLTCI